MVDLIGQLSLDAPRGGVLPAVCRHGHLYDKANTYWYTTRSGKKERRCRACQRRNDAARPRKLRFREAELRRRYGISPTEYDAILAAQGGVCAICQGGPTKRYGAFDVDHDHETDRVRGLLCRRCNTGLGYFEDQTFAEAARDYLARGGEPSS